MHHVGFLYKEMWGLKSVHFIPNCLVLYLLLVGETIKPLSDATCTNPSQCAGCEPLNVEKCDPTLSVEVNFTQMLPKEAYKELH